MLKRDSFLKGGPEKLASQLPLDCYSFQELFIYYYVPSFEIQADIFMSLESI